MNFDKIAICNMALANIGEPAIQSLDQPNKGAVACKLRYDEARLAALAGAEWNFASTYKPGVAVDMTPKSPWSRVFKYPAEALRVWRIQRQPGETEVPFEVTDRPDGDGRVIHTHAIAPVFVYTRDKDRVDQFDIEFIQALSWLLASMIVIPIRKSRDDQQAAWKMWVALSSLASAQNRNEGVEETDRLASYQEARHG